MSWNELLSDTTVASRQLLRSFGATDRMLTAAVRFGHLVRARRDHYVLPICPPDVISAVRVGGRLGCVSALRAAGVFAVLPRHPHVHVDPDASRCRSAQSVRVPLPTKARRGVTVHWNELVDPDAQENHTVGLLDALAQAIQCQSTWLAVASIDSALNQRLVSALQIEALFTRLPPRFAALLDLVDGRAEAGQETILRMIVREAGLSYRIQVTVSGVGRVDIIVEDCVVVEADSRLAHDGWELHVRDRDRDLALARLGLPTLRPVYQRIMYTPNDVRDAILGLVATHRR